MSINYFYIEYKTDCIITKQIRAIEAFIERHKELSLLFTMANFEAGISFDIDICKLYNDNEFMNQWPNFKDEIYENPTNTLNCIKLGIHQVSFLLLHVLFLNLLWINICMDAYTHIHNIQHICVNIMWTYCFFIANLLLMYLFLWIFYHDKSSLHIS